VKKLLLLLVPLALFAQVEIDTVIRLPSWVGPGMFVPELNKLYVQGGSGLYAIDCSTYSLKADIPTSGGDYRSFTWNWRWQKLYYKPDGPTIDSTLVIDGVTDSIVGSLKAYNSRCTDVYLSDLDRLYQPARDTLFAFDCAADTVVRRLPLLSYFASWDSVGHKLYVGQGGRRKLTVYDYIADSVLKVIDVSAVFSDMPDALLFNHSHHRAVVGRYWGGPFPYNLGIIDTERDTLVGVLPVRIGANGLTAEVAVDQQDGKVYIADNDGVWATPDSLWVVDCATDSVVKKVEYWRRGSTVKAVRWVPWSNRIYLALMNPDADHESCITVLDCSTDSIIVPEMLLNESHIQDIQLDPIRERIFVIGVNGTEVYVLRDVEGGVAEEPASTRPALASGLQVQMTSGGYEVRYSVSSACRIDLSIYDLMGREVRRLVAESVTVGEHRVFWDRTDQNGAVVAPGVYFIRLDTPGFNATEKAVVSR